MLPLTRMGLLLVSITVTECLIALSFVCLRGWVRIRLLNGLQPDDYLLWVAMILLIATTGETVAAVWYGLGHHATDLNMQEIIQVVPYMFAYPVMLCFSLFMGKAAVVAFLLLIVVKTIHKWILWLSIGSLGLLSILELIGLFIQCYPVQANWKPLLAKVCHFDINLLGSFLTGYGVFLDFFLAALPWFFFSSLQLNRREKFTVCISLSVGIFAGICGVFRFIELFKLHHDPDPLLAFSKTMLWTSTESCVTIICVCASVIRGLYHRYIKGPVIRGDSTDSTGVAMGRQSPQYGHMLQNWQQNRMTANASIWSDGDVILKDNNKTMVTGNRSRWGREEPGNRDSEESRLGADSLIGQLNIKKATSVVLDYESGAEAGNEDTIIGNEASSETLDEGRPSLSTTKCGSSFQLVQS